jgi:type IV pilus assembly protein PilQ
MNWKVAMGIVGLGLTFVTAPHAAYSQDGVPPAVAAEAQVPAAEATANKKSGLVSIDFRDADIKNVLKVLAYNSGVNIVAGPEVTGLVTIQLKDVPWQKALEVVLSTYGYAYERRGDIIAVTTIENLKKRREDSQVLAEQEPLITQTFTLNFGKASDIIGSIEKMKTPRGSINFDQRTNTLIVTDIQSNLDLMDEVVEALDAVTPQVVIEVKVVETTLTNTENLGIDWTVSATASGAKRPTTFPFKTQDSTEFLPGTLNAPAATDFSYGTLSTSALSAVLEMLKSRSNTNILSNPKIVTLDNQKARIVVGSQYPIPSYTYNEQQARLQVSGWEYKDIGIIFEVTPHVNNAGFVTIDLQPKITAILDFVTVENTQLPRLSTEEATTKVMIKDGDTLVIAGLIKDQVTETKKRVPFLGDIPLVGEVFRKSSTTKTKTELLIFLTPHIITPELDTASAGRK